MASNVCVVGSIHMDLVVHAPRFVKPGETLIGGSFEVHPGGKGANQAVAASRMGASVTLVGCIGDDEWGSEMRAVLTSHGLDIHSVRTCERSHTGVGVITVVPGGENAIVVAPGANARVSVVDVDAAADEISDADMLLLQCEIPVEANARAAELARRSETTVMLNASPAIDVPSALLSQVDVLVVNRGEACTILGDESGEIAPAGLARRLASLGPDRVVVTIGAEGAIHFNGTEVNSFDAYPVKAIDATGSGDAFVGALAAMRSEGARLKDAVSYACGAGGLAASVAGAIPSLPTREAVEALVEG